MVETLIRWTAHSQVLVVVTPVMCSQVIVLKSIITDSATTTILRRFWEAEDSGVSDYTGTANRVPEAFGKSIKQVWGRQEVPLPERDEVNLQDGKKLAKDSLE